MRDLYREEKEINFEEAFSKGREIDKKYYFVPLKQDPTSPQLSYSIDRDLMKYVVQLNKRGYRASQASVLQELAEIPTEEQKRTYLKQSLLVNAMSNSQEKKHRVYHFIEMLDKL